MARQAKYGPLLAVALLGVVISLLVLSLLGLASPAAAQEGETDGDAATEVVAGTISYENEDGERVPVESVVITVATPDGDEIDEAETGEDGRFEIGLPGPGEYLVSIDPDSIPDGLSLRDPDRTSLPPFRMSNNQSRTVLFPLVEGEGGGARAAKGRLARLPQLTFEGIKFGLIIAMSAVGLSLIYGTTGLVNFAHGELVTLGALVGYFFNVTLGLHMFIAAPIAVAACAAIGGGSDLAFWRPLRARGTSLIALLVVSIGLSLAVRYLFLYQFFGRSRPYDDFAIQTDTHRFLSVTFVWKDVWTVVVCTLLLVLVALALQYTRIGKATRAVSDNKDLAESSGIDVDRVILTVWVAGAGLAAVGGVFLGLSEQVSWQGGFQLLLLMFAGVTLGGLGTAYGALVGSLVVGFFVQVSTLWIPSELKNVAALAVLILILLVRPQGILGQKERVG